MQKAEENQNHYEKKHLNNINRQLEQDERRRKNENEKIKKKEEAFSNFKKIAKSLPNDCKFIVYLFFLLLIINIIILFYN